MGYKRNNRVYKLVFKDEDMDGLEVRCRSLPLAKYMELVGLVEGGVDLSNVGDILGEFAQVIVSWNLVDDDDQPIPPSAETLLAQDYDFVLAIINAWSAAIAGVSGPLERPSPDGEMEAQIPMAV